MSTCMFTSVTCISCQHGIFFKMPCWEKNPMLTWENLMLGKNASHVDMRVIHVDSHVNMGHLMSTWHFFPNMALTMSTWSTFS